MDERGTYDPAKWAWMELPPDDPRRVAKVLAYIEGGSPLGLGKTEWETVKAVLRNAVSASAEQK